MAKDQFTYGQLVMVETIMTLVLQMAMLAVSIRLLLDQLTRMVDKPTMMRTVLLKWQLLSAITQMIPATGL